MANAWMITKFNRLRDSANSYCKKLGLTKLTELTRG